MKYRVYKLKDGFCPVSGALAEVLKLSPFKRQPVKMAKETQTIHSSSNCLSVFEHFVGLALKRLSPNFFQIKKHLVHLIATSHFRCPNIAKFPLQNSVRLILIWGLSEVERRNKPYDEVEIWKF